MGSVIRFVYPVGLTPASIGAVDSTVVCEGNEQPVTKSNLPGLLECLPTGFTHGGWFAGGHSMIPKSTGPGKSMRMTKMATPTTAGITVHRRFLPCRFICSNAIPPSELTKRTSINQTISRIAHPFCLFRGFSVSYHENLNLGHCGAFLGHSGGLCKLLN